MKIPHYFISYLLFFLVCEVNSQDLEMTSGPRTKVIKAGTFITVELPTPNQEPCENCPMTTMTGQLVSSAEGKVSLRVLQSSEPLVEGLENVGALSKRYNNKNAPVLSIPKEVIMSITKAGSKSVRESAAGQIIGTILIWAGSGHLISVPFVESDDKGPRNTLLLMGLVETVAGIAMLSSFQRKPYITSINCPNKKKGKGNQIWTIG